MSDLTFYRNYIYANSEYTLEQAEYIAEKANELSLDIGELFDSCRELDNTPLLLKAMDDDDLLCNLRKFTGVRLAVEALCTGYDVTAEEVPGFDALDKAWGYFKDTLGPEKKE